MVALKYLSRFWRDLEVSLINCQVNLDLNLTNYSGYWCSKSSHKTFSITYTELYVLVVTLSTQDNVKMFEQLNIFFKRTIN